MPLESSDCQILMTVLSRFEIDAPQELDLAASCKVKEEHLSTGEFHGIYLYTPITDEFVIGHMLFWKSFLALQRLFESRKNPQHVQGSNAGLSLMKSWRASFAMLMTKGFISRALASSRASG